jgi:cytidylate kinase
LIHERDRAAEAYLKRFHEIDWSDSTLYHLVVNTAKWDVELAADVVIHALHRLTAVEQPEAVDEQAAAA